ncbi:hypothetical protein A1Q2_01816 [Trichosporon asahii var. asahii CBS 8904]|uniref:Uncharacterized protein n=1 Tax=Trichosporon asahii var. asahii (strain CBS 8904) TaxID=1220162 RepID=K1W4K7_TRIAC|nr:hypothetical protein A1Q2_01816 [Trichosporon asahii var. asahii CBS 8904]
MDIDTRAPSPASDTIEEIADPPWTDGSVPQANSNPTASPQSSSERDQSDVTCNLAALAGLAGSHGSGTSGRSAGAVTKVPASAHAPGPPTMPAPASLPPPLLNPQAAATAVPTPAQQPAPTGVHVCSNCNVAQPASTSMTIHPSQPSGSPSLLASIGRRSAGPAQTHSMSPSLLPAVPQRSTPSPPPSGDLEKEVRYLRTRLKEAEALSARLHGQLESSQQRLSKERQHHESITEMWANRVGVLEVDNQKLRARLGLGDKVPDMASGIMGEGRLSFGASKGHTRRTSKDVNAGKKRSPSSDPRRGTPPRHIDIDPPSLSSLSAGTTTTPKATTPRCQDVCPIQCSQQLVVGQEQP